MGPPVVVPADVIVRRSEWHGARQTKRGGGMCAKPVLLGLWAVLADHGTCFVFEGDLENTT